MESYWHKCQVCNHRIVVDLQTNQELNSKKCPLCESEDSLTKDILYTRRGIDELLPSEAAKE